MSFTYTTLKQAIQDYTEYTESSFVTNIDNFIQTAEERILKLVELDVFRKNATATTSNSEFLNLPSDFLSSLSCSVQPSGGDKTFLLLKDVNFLQEYSPQSSTEGQPKYYAIYDSSNLLLAPNPGSTTYTVELHYLYRPTSIVSAGTTWLGTNAPNTLLYGSLVEAYIYMKGEPDILQVYEKRFLEEAQRLKNFGEALENTDNYRMGQLIRSKT